MTLREFPSEAFPAFPNIQVDAGVEWDNWNLPGSVLSLKKVKKGSFTSNVLINVRTVSLDYGFDAYKAEIQGYAKNLANIKFISEGLHDVNGCQWEVVEYAYIDEDSGPLAQFLAATFIEKEAVKIMVSFTGTVGIKDQTHNPDYIEIQNIFRSVKIDE